MNPRLISGTVRVVAFSAAMLLLTMLVVTRSQAAFTASTANPQSGFQSGELTLADDDAGTAMFDAATNARGMVPNTAVVECITVTYTGDVAPAPVKLYGTSSGALAPYLDLTVEVGTGGSSSSCAGFSASGGPLFSGTLAGFSSAHADWSNGIAAFTATGNPTSRTFRFTAEVQDTDAAQGLTANAAFTWETQVG